MDSVNKEVPGEGACVLLQTILQVILQTGIQTLVCFMDCVNNEAPGQGAYITKEM